MIQVYDKTNTDYSKNGNMLLTPTSCTLEAELNGAWVLILEHPIDAVGRWKSIVEDAVIQCDTFMPKPQRFRIYEKGKNSNGVIAYARPVFQDTKDTLLLDVRPTDKNGQDALDIILAGTGFSGKSDISNKATTYLIRKNIPNALFGKDENSFLNRWGGEVLYDNETVIINERAGGDYGVSCEFGKNLREIEETVNLDGVITRIIPTSYQGYMLEGDTPWVDSPNVGKYATVRMREVQFKNIALAEDMDGGYENLEALRAALRVAAENMFSVEKVDEPSIGYVVDMVNLAKTIEYKNYKILESVGLGDTILCKNKKLDIETSARVTRIVYDCIRKRNDEIELGNFQDDYFSRVQDLAGRIQQTITPSGTVRADTIQGIINSMNVQLRAQKTIAQTQEIRAMLFEDLDPDSPTYGAMSMGTMGLQISSERTEDGRDWNWTTAVTAKGALADIFIAGILSDKSGKNFWNLDTGEIRLTSPLVITNTGESLDDALNNLDDKVDNIEVGARNLLRNSKNLVFEDYTFEEASVVVTYDEDGNTTVESNAISATADDGDAVVEAPILTCSDDGVGNVTLASALDEDTGETAEMKTLTIGGYTFEVVDEKARAMIGYLDDLLTDDKSSLVAAINEIFRTGGSGSGGSSSNNAKLSVTNTSGWLSKSVAQGSDCYASFNWSSVEGELPTGNGVMTIYVGGVLKSTKEIKQGDVSVNFREYLSAGANTIRVRVADVYGNTLSINFNVAVVVLSVSSAFDGTAVYSGAITYTYTPTGSVTKNMEFWLDGVQIGTSAVTTSGRQQSFTIPAQEHGHHTFETFCTAVIDGDTIESNHLYYDLICTVDGDTTPIIAISTQHPEEVEQYSNIVTFYRVYNPAGLTADITLEADGVEVSSLTVDRTEQTWSYQPVEVGELIQTIRCGDVYRSWTLTITESDIQVEAETEALALHLSSYGRSNNEANPGVWENNGVSTEFSNFNFVSDGWVNDENDITVLRVTGDARLSIPYKIFENDFRTTGKTLEFELATRDVLNYDAEVLSCYSGGRGFIITAQQLTMTSEQSSLGTRYKEDEHIRVSIVAEKKSENRLLQCYINGILTGTVQYPAADDFSQAFPVGITIGSNDCTIDLYNIRAYDNNLTRFQILDNWIADTRDVEERVNRYKRNDIYDEYGQVTIDKLPNDLPYMVLVSSDILPQFKGDKKTIEGYFVDPLHPERNYTFTAQIDVQGTSSQYYYVKNYKIKYKNGFILSDGTTAETYQMNENAVPTNEFTMKADVASSEGAFNVVLSMLYNELNPCKTPAQEADSRVRRTIEGFPIVMFWDNGTETKFLGKYNFNNDKGTPEVFGYKEGDESWEILQNGTARVGWHSADFSGDDWKNDFEARYPEDNTDTTKLQALAEWLVTTDTDQATGETIDAVTYEEVEYTTDTEEYRLAKFSAELSDHFKEEAIIFYYLFTEIFLSIDQREKNAFPYYVADWARWIVDFYDADSSCGTDNKGNLAFDYWLEDIDYTEGGDPVYNGQNSVLWKNIRATRYAEVMAMYQNMRVNNLISYEIVNAKFEAHQSKWSEAIFNEDMWRKCIEPLINDGDGLYLPMLQGKKEQWMKWWLYNRFRYLDSKYITGTSMTNRITIRAHAKANVTLTSYVNMYGHVYYNAEMVEHRMTRGQEYEFVWAASGAEDAVIGINDADMLTSLGDLSPLMVELIDASGATHITSLKIGDSSEDYANYSMNSITLGNNILLRSLDARNCPNLTQSVDISGCTNIEEVYFDGTAITGVSLPNGGGLKILHLPETIANLKLRNLTALTEFVMPSYANVTTLWIENVSDVANSVTVDIILSMATGSRVRLVNVDWTLESADVLDKLNTMRGMTETGENTTIAVVSGKAHFTNIPISTYLIAKERFPYLSITADKYELDVLEVTPSQLFITSDNKLFMLASGGHSTKYTGVEIDQYISDHITYSEEE